MEEMLMYATDLMCEIDELMDENDAIIPQRMALLQSLAGEDIDPTEITSRVQALDAILCTNHRLMADNYAELKRIDKEIGWCMTESPEEEYEDEEDDSY